jgi:hypothetical protein
MSNSSVRAARAELSPAVQRNPPSGAQGSPCVGSAARAAAVRLGGVVHISTDYNN